MEAEVKPKKRSRTIVILVVVLVSLGLCVGGFMLPGKEMPEISMKAEIIPMELPIPGFTHGIPNTLPTAILTALVLVIIALFYNRAQRRAERTGVESSLLVAMDAIIETVYSFVENIAGKHARTFFPLVASFFFFILLNNWLGLLPGVGSIGIRGLPHGAAAQHEEAVPAEGEEHAEEEAEHAESILIPFLRSANADLSTTLALAIISMIAVQYFGLRLQGPAYLRKFINFTAPPDSGKLKPVLMIANGFAGLLEIISELSKIFSFAFRLFGNIFAGEVLLIVVSFLAAFLAAIPFMGLELFVGLIQALVFSMLSLVFYTMASHHH